MWAAAMAITRYPFIAIVLIMTLAALWINHHDQSEPNDWLIATISPALGQLRRNMIRNTWQKVYKGPPATMRFILASAGEELMPIIEAENATYGDLIMLSHLTDSKELGMKSKEIDFFQWLVQSGMSFKFVSKLDDDSYLDATGFYNHFLEPLQQREEKDGNIMIARKLMWWNPEFPYPGGQFYTLSWSLAEALAQGYATDPARDDYADLLVGRLLYDTKVEFEFIEMDNSVAFDYDPNNPDKISGSHSITQGSLNPHQLKDNNVFMQVAQKMQALSQ
jgi:hypothetical protein